MSAVTSLVIILTKPVKRTKQSYNSNNNNFVHKYDVHTNTEIRERIFV